MVWYEWFAIIALAICIISCIYHFFKIISLGKPPEYARRSGHIGKAVRYSFTGAMSPKAKESAYLHLPTYMAGIIYHLGTFLSIFIFFLLLADFSFPEHISLLIAGILVISAISGYAVLIKRLSVYELMKLSNPDDYISNVLVSTFQLFSAVMLVNSGFAAGYFMITGCLLLYFPLGKLKHAVYFFAARYHLGLFYGWRGVWPPKPIKK